MSNAPIFGFLFYGLIFVGAYLLTLGFWFLASYVYKKLRTPGEKITPEGPGPLGHGDR
jgi:hypothetical protein